MNPKDRVFDPLLTNVAKGYKPQNYLATALLPVFKVKKQSGIYYEYDRAHLQLTDSARAAGSPTNEIDPKAWTRANFYAEDHALKQLVEDEEVDQAEGAFDPMSDATENVVERLMTAAEKALADQLTSTSVVTQNTTLSGTSQWSDPDDSDPIGDIETGKDTIEAATGLVPNTLALGRDAFNALKVNAQIIDRIKYTGRDIVTEDLLAALFGVRRVVVGRAVYNTASEGQTPSMSNIWGDNALLAYVPETPRLKEVALGFHMQYGDHAVDKWYDKDRKGTYVRDSWYYDQVFVSMDAAYLIKDTNA